MVAQIKDLALVGMFITIIIMSLAWPDPEPCPEPVIQERTVTKVQVVRVPVIEKWTDTVYVPKYITQAASPDPVPQVISTYSDSLQLGDCQVAYDMVVAGEMRNMNIRARRTTSQVTKITSTEFITHEVERKVYPTRFYLGAGLGGSRKMIDNVNASAMLATKKHAYALDYDFIDKSVSAKVYFKLF